MNILVTGGAGYVGISLVEKLIDIPHINTVAIYDNLSQGSSKSWFVKPNQSENRGKIKFIKADLLDTRSLRKALQSIDTVIHLAEVNQKDGREIDPHTYEQINHWGTAELVYAIEQSESVNKLIHLSTVAVYGTSDNKFSEIDECIATSPYGISKMRGEKHIIRLSEKIPSLIFRSGTIYGYNEHFRPDTLINKWMFEANFLGKVSVLGNGKQKRPFVYLNHLTETLAKSIQETNSAIYNVSDTHISVLELLDIMKAIYSDMEFSFINQHTDYPSLSLNTDKIMASQLYTAPQEMSNNLLYMKGQFAY